MKRNIWLVVFILLVAIVQGCAEQGSLPPPTNGEEPETQQPEEPGDGTENKDATERKGQIGPVGECPEFVMDVTPSLEAAKVKEENELHVYVRNLGKSVSINVNILQWYFNNEYMGQITGVYESYCETEAVKWDESVVICILLRSDKGFSTGDHIKIVMICSSITIADFTIEEIMFKNLKISTL